MVTKEEKGNLGYPVKHLKKEKEIPILCLCVIPRPSIEPLNSSLLQMSGQNNKCLKPTVQTQELNITAVPPFG